MITEKHLGLHKDDVALFRRLSSPSSIQDYLNTLRCNYEKGGDTLRSPRLVIKHKEAHCLEGALFAAAVLWFHGEKPLLLDLKSSKEDLDHVVALFRKDGCWGAISKTNHAVLRYREPIYKTVRELALSYFHEYFTDDGKKTLRSFSKPFDLRVFGVEWITTTDDLWDIGGALDDSPHEPLVTRAMIRKLRKADDIEIKAGTLKQYKK